MLEDCNGEIFLSEKFGLENMINAYKGSITVPIKDESGFHYETVSILNIVFSLPIFANIIYASGTQFPEVHYIVLSYTDYFTINNVLFIASRSKESYCSLFQNSEEYYKACVKFKEAYQSMNFTNIGEHVKLDDMSDKIINELKRQI